MGQSDSALANIQGFQVARVLPNSPAHIAGLLPYFDIITAIDHLPLSTEASDFFKTYVKKSIGKTVTLTVFNLRIRSYRDVPLTPTDSWGGAGLLGCSIDWTSAERCLSNTWHILDVSSDSPAVNHPDIVQQRDYIIGMQPFDEQVITMLKDEADFGQRLEAWRQLRQSSPNTVPPSLLFLVFDSVDNSIKEVLLDMKNKFTLGLDVANGYLHVIPSTPAVQKLPSIKRFVVAEAPVATETDFPKPPPSAMHMPIQMPAGDRTDLTSPLTPASPHPTPVLGVDSPPPTSRFEGMEIVLPPALQIQSSAPVSFPHPPHGVAPKNPVFPTAMPPPLQFPTFPTPPGAQ